jgi:hypothetical protein
MSKRGTRRRGAIFRAIDSTGAPSFEAEIYSPLKIKEIIPKKEVGPPLISAA